MKQVPAENAKTTLNELKKMRPREILLGEWITSVAERSLDEIDQANAEMYLLHYANDNHPSSNNHLVEVISRALGEKQTDWSKSIEKNADKFKNLRVEMESKMQSIGQGKENINEAKKEIFSAILNTNNQEQSTIIRYFETSKTLALGSNNESSMDY